MPIFCLKSPTLNPTNPRGGILNDMKEELLERALSSLRYICQQIQDPDAQEIDINEALILLSGAGGQLPARNPNDKAIKNWECSRCDGAGYIQMPPEYDLTLSDICKIRGQFTTEDLSGGTCPAMNNRLCVLEERGYLERVGKRGKLILWQTPVLF